MKKIVVTLLIVVTAIITVAAISLKVQNQDKTNGMDESEIAEEYNDVKKRQLEMEYLGEVEYKEENKQNIEQTVDELIQAYIGKLEDIDKISMDISLTVSTFFTNVADNFESADYKKEAEYEMRNNEGYRVTAQYSYSRDCVIATVSYPSNRIMLKLTYEDNTITSVTEYK